MFPQHIFETQYPLPMSNKIDSTEVREGPTGCLKMGYLPEYCKEYCGLQFMALIQRGTATIDILRALVKGFVGARTELPST